MHFMYSGMAKGTSWAEVISNSKKKIKPVAFAIVELRKSEGICSQAVSLFPRLFVC